MSTPAERAARPQLRHGEKLLRPAREGVPSLGGNPCWILTEIASKLHGDAAGRLEITSSRAATTASNPLSSTTPLVLLPKPKCKYSSALRRLILQFYAPRRSRFVGVLASSASTPERGTRLPGGKGLAILHYHGKNHR